MEKGVVLAWRWIQQLFEGTIKTISKGEHTWEIGSRVPFQCQLLYYRHKGFHPGAVPAHDTLSSPGLLPMDLYRVFC